MQQYLAALESAVAGLREVQRYLVCCVFCGIRFLADYRNPGREDLYCPFGCRRCHEREASKRRSEKYRHTPHGKRKKNQRDAQYYADRRRRCPSAGGRRQDSSLAPPLADIPLASEASADTPLTSEASADTPLTDEASAAITFSSADAAPGEAAGVAVCRSASAGSPVTDGAEASAVQDPSATIAIRVGGVMLTESDVTGSPMIPYVQRLYHRIDGVRLTLGQVVFVLQEQFRQRSIARQTRIAYALAFLHQHPPRGEVP